MVVGCWLLVSRVRILCHSLSLSLTHTAFCDADLSTQDYFVTLKPLCKIQALTSHNFSPSLSLPFSLTHTQILRPLSHGATCFFFFISFGDTYDLAGDDPGLLYI